MRSLVIAAVAFGLCASSAFASPRKAPSHQKSKIAHTSTKQHGKALSNAKASLAASEAHTREMLKLTPETRLEQRCNARAMGDVSREHKGFRPDELVAYAFADPAVNGERMTAPGAAIRSGGLWYRLSYSCETSNESLDVKTFAYQLGDPVPRKEWDEHYLVPR